MVEYELWDIEHGEMLISGFDKEQLKQVLFALFDERSVLLRLDSLELVVYNPQQEVRYLTGIEAIEQWLSDNE